LSGAGERAGGPRDIRGTFEVEGRRFAIAASSFNEIVVNKLVEGAVACFTAHGVSGEDLVVAWTPGAFELPLVARRFAESGRFDAVVCLGAVVRGETAHFDFVAGEAARGIQNVGLSTGVPVLFGVLTADTMQQALERAGGKMGNKGWDSAMAAMRIVNVLDELPGVENVPAGRADVGGATALPLAGAARRRREASGANEEG
jgi:6,7-dimethyl-8-ribityllumazine synthase